MFSFIGGERKNALLRLLGIGSYARFARFQDLLS